MTTCGLDFGTSNSTIGVLKNRQPAMVPLEQSDQGDWQTTLPSALFFAFEDDRIHFGRQAIQRYTSGEPGRLMRSLKSILGSAFMGESTQVKRRRYSYEEIIGFYISSLKQRAEKYRGDNENALDSVVVGRPVFFNDDDPVLDREAENHLANIAKAAGFTEVSFQYEPIAAALHYEQQVIGEELALIVDIGGGTSDFTVVRLSRDRHADSERHEDFLASHGIHIGGTDFDRRLSIAGVMNRFGMGEPLADRPLLEMPGHYYFDLATWHKIHLMYDQSVQRELKDIRITLRNKQPVDRLIALLANKKGHQLAAMVEQAKIALSSQDHAGFNIAELLPEFSSVESFVLTRRQLLDSLESDLQKVFGAMDVALVDAGLTHQQINTVFTTGGSTALPMIQAAIQSAFPTANIVAGDLYTSVGSGLLQEAVRRYGPR